jgi:CRISPR-associated protein Cas4
MIDMSKNLLKVLLEEPSARPFPVAGLVEKIESGYLSDVISKQKPRKNFSPSSLAYTAGGGGCPRYWYFKFTGEDQINDTDAYAVANMKNGTLSHSRIQDAIEKAGIAVETELKVTNEDPPMFGFVDSVISWLQEEIPVEIKTMREESFQYRVNSNKTPNYHKMQLLFYMKLLNKKRGIFLYESKNSHSLHAIPIEMTKEDEKWLEQTFEWMRTVKRAFNESELPTKPYRSNSKVCKKCPFRNVCADAGKGVVKIPALEPLSE